MESKFWWYGIESIDYVMYLLCDKWRNVINIMDWKSYIGVYSKEVIWEIENGNGLIVLIVV